MKPYSFRHVCDDNGDWLRDDNRILLYDVYIGTTYLGRVSERLVPVIMRWLEQKGFVSKVVDNIKRAGFWQPCWEEHKDELDQREYEMMEELDVL